MFGRETRMLLRHYLEQGTSKSTLARQLGVSRDTIHRWIRDGELDRDLEMAAMVEHVAPSKLARFAAPASGVREPEGVREWLRAYLMIPILTRSRDK